MTNVITINGATVDADLFAALNKRALQELRAEHEAKEKAKELAKDFKDTVESAAMQTKLDKKELAGYFKARFQESLPKEDEEKPVGTGVVISRGELYTLLNQSLDD
jgi:hypothetical protein